MSKRKPKALFFDVFGTLVDWRTSIAGHFQQALTPLGIEEDWLEMASQWRAEYQPSMEPIRRGERGFVRLDDLHLENLNAVLDRYNLNNVSQETRSQLALEWRRLKTWPEVDEAMLLLSKDFLLAPVSNGNTALMVNLARYCAFPWDAILGSEPAQNYKPNPIVYQTAADWLGLHPEDCMMVAAHNYDLTAAKQAGLQTGFFPRPTEYGPAQTKDCAATEQWDIVAEDLLDLAHQLARRV